MPTTKPLTDAEINAFNALMGEQTEDAAFVEDAPVVDRKGDIDAMVDKLVEFIDDEDLKSANDLKNELIDMNVAIDIIDGAVTWVDNGEDNA